MNTTTNAKARNTDRHVGIDVGKAMLDIAIYEVDLYLQEHNCPEGIRRLINRLKRYKLTRILVEATGGYERALVEACVEADLPVIVVQPMHIRQFAKSQGILAKTDKIDAWLIAEFGVKIKPGIKPICSNKVRYIKDLLARKRQLNMARTQELNRSHKAVTAMKTTHNRLIKVLDKEIEWVNTKLTKAVGEVTEWQRLYESLSSVPGIGDGAAYTLMGELPELGSLSNRQVASVWPGAVQSRQRHHARQTTHSRWPCSNQNCALHGDDVSHSTQPGDETVLSFSDPLRQTQEGGADRLHAQMVRILNAMVRDDCLWQEA